MLKQKEYDWKDSNLADIGSQLDKDTRLDSAKTEKAWNGVGKEPELRVWRVEKFKIKKWPTKKIGQFHEGDSYIVLHTYKQKGSKNKKLLYDIFFWIGSNSTQDEYGVAAYKTVELDAKLRDAAVQHREVQHHETKEFKALFKKLVYLEGGIETGFRHYEPEIPDPELFRIKGRRSNVSFSKVKLRKDSLNSNDVFILDTWTKLFQWNGKDANPDEKMKATQYLDSVVLARNGDAKKHVFEEGQESPEFWDIIPAEWRVGCVQLKEYDVDHDGKKNKDDSDEQVKAFRKKLYRISDNNGSGGLQMKKIVSGDRSKKNNVPKACLDTNDVFLLDDGFIVWVWVGKKSSSKEKGGGMSYAMKYIQKNNRPAYMPVRQIREGSEPLVFLEHLHDGDKPSNCVIA